MAAPVKNTCPDIDSLLTIINEAYKIARDGRIRFKGDDSEDLFNDIENKLWGADRMLEDLRRDNSALREWGHSLEGELHDAGETISELENQIEQIKYLRK